MQQVAQDCQSGDQNALKTCFANEGVTADQIDQHLGSWDAYFNKGGMSGMSYEGITYVSLADAPSNKSILPQTIAMAQPTNVGGVTFAPNIKVIGFILVSFKQNGSVMGGPTEAVGIASDGTAKMAMIEPQK